MEIQTEDRLKRKRQTHRQQTFTQSGDIHLNRAQKNKKKEQKKKRVVKGKRTKKECLVQDAVCTAVYTVCPGSSDPPEKIF